jgi:hypothetical protein
MQQGGCGVVEVADVAAVGRRTQELPASEQNIGESEVGASRCRWFVKGDQGQDQAGSGAGAGLQESGQPVGARAVDSWLCEYLTHRGWAAEHTFYSKRNFLRDAVADRPGPATP